MEAVGVGTLYINVEHHKSGDAAGRNANQRAWITAPPLDDLRFIVSGILETVLDYRGFPPGPVLFAWEDWPASPGIDERCF